MELFSIRIQRTFQLVSTFLFITEFVFESAFNQIDGGSGKVVTKGKEFF